ncbi:MAG: carbohydrate kinase [Muribaculaceae bacterium]|nr:carbohydrate kinase [Muribaculaceae bacterium]
MTETVIDKVVGIGELLWDILPDGKKIGGAPANFAYHVSQFGLPGCAVSAIGTDDLGDEMTANLAEVGLKSMLATVPYPTGTVTIKLDSDGVPRYDITEGVAWDNIPFTPELEELARHTRAVCFGSLAQRSAVSRATIGAFLDAIPQTPDTLIVFDINLRQHFYTEEIIRTSMERCNILKINDEELKTVSAMLKLPDGTQQERSRVLLEMFGLKMLILTCGVNGSYVFTPDSESFLPTPEVEVADTVGAGDSFTASFIAAILRGLPVAEAHALAARTSAYVCSCPGAMPILPATLTDF